jgi:hypothetical protein
MCLTPHDVMPPQAMLSAQGLDAAALQALFGSQAQTLDVVFDGLASCIDLHFETGVLKGLIA